MYSTCLVAQVIGTRECKTSFYSLKADSQEERSKNEEAVFLCCTAPRKKRIKIELELLPCWRQPCSISLSPCVAADIREKKSGQELAETEKPCAETHV